MAFNTSYILNKQINTVSMGSIAVVRRRSGILEAGRYEVLYDTPNSFILDFLEFGTDGPSCQLDIIYHGVGPERDRGIGTVNNDGTGFEGIRPSTITDNGAGPLQIVEHNVNLDRYKYKLDRPLYFPEGCIIRSRNWMPTDQNVALRIYGREFK